MKRLIACLSVLYICSLYSFCPSPVAGDRCWNIAATALELIITTESILDELLVNIFVDITGIYTVADAINAGIDSADMSLYTINSNLDVLITDITQTQSKLTILENQLTPLNTIIDQISADIAGTYTALDALQTTIVSELDILATQLETVQSVITDITATAIDHNVTIASQLDLLQIDVNELNSVLDSINWPNLNTSIDTLSSLIGLLADNVNTLQNSIQVGFVGTFSVLDAQMQELGIIESTAEHIHLHNTTDESGVFTALAQLDATLNNIESLVDIVTLVNAKNTAIVTESLMERAVSRVDIIESKIAPLPSVADHVISVLERVELPLLDRGISVLDITLTELDTLESQADTISSKLSEVIIDNRNNASTIALLANSSIAIASSLDSFNPPISKLSVVNSQLDDVVQDAFTIESLIDKIFVGLVTINSSVDHLISEADLINSALGTIETMDFTISSKLDLTIDNLTTVNSNLDQITNLSTDSFSKLGSIESSLERTSSIFDTLAIASIESRLAVTSNLETSVISKLDLANTLIATLNNEAQGLINDFQSTWTILNKINTTSLPTIQTTLNIIESTLEHLNPHDISTVFTAIDAIVRNETTVNSQVDVYNSMVDAFNRLIITDFNGVFTAITAVNASEISSTSQLATISSKLSVVQTELGFPIYNRNIPLTITTPGRYYLAENISYSGASNAITISTNDVSIDLNERTLRYTGASSVSGILINNVNNIKIINGTISNFINFNIITGTTATSNIIIRDVVLLNYGIYFSVGTGSDCKFYNNTLFSTLNQRLINVEGTYRNIVFDNCFIEGTADSTGAAFGFQIIGTATKSNIQISNCFMSVNNNSVVSDAIGLSPTGTIDGLLIQNNIMLATRMGINVSTSLTNATIMGNIITSPTVSTSGLSLNNASILGVIFNKNDVFSAGSGISTTSNPSSMSLVVTFNQFVQNTAGNIVLTRGVGTFLGNFAFNTNATGNPPNTNYNFSGTSINITGKYITGSQRGSFGDFPEKWHNINMLP